MNKFACLQLRNFSNQTGRKLIKPMAGRRVVQKLRERNTALSEKAEKLQLAWRIVGSTILHRYPVITKDPEPWENDMLEVQDYLSNKRRELLVERVQGTDSELINTKNPSYEEILESMPFQPAPRVTEADRTNDRKSMERRLQDSLYLIVKRNRSDNSWQFPQGKWLEEENMRQTAERVIDRAIGKSKRWFMSNAPVGHYCYEYPQAIQEKRNNFGAKVFYYRAQVLSGSIKLQTKLYTDYAWVARDEVKEYFDQETAEFLTNLLPN